MQGDYSWMKKSDPISWTTTYHIVKVSITQVFLNQLFEVLVIDICCSEIPEVTVIHACLEQVFCVWLLAIIKATLYLGSQVFKILIYIIMSTYSIVIWEKDVMSYVC